MTYFKALSQSKMDIMVNISNYYHKVVKGDVELKSSASSRILDREIG